MACQIFVHDVPTLDSTCNQPCEQAVAYGFAVLSSMTIENGSINGGKSDIDRIDHDLLSRIVHGPDFNDHSRFRNGL